MFWLCPGPGNGKNSWHAFCDPQASYADGIDLTKFYFVAEPGLAGIQKGDIVILGVNNSAGGHAAVVSYIPSPFNINNILVDQVPWANGGEETDKNLGDQIIIYQANPIGYCRTGYLKRVSVVLLNNYDRGVLDAEQQIYHMSRRGNIYIR